MEDHHVGTSAGRRCGVEEAAEAAHVVDGRAVRSEEDATATVRTARVKPRIELRHKQNDHIFFLGW